MHANPYSFEDWIVERFDWGLNSFAVDKDVCGPIVGLCRLDEIVSNGDADHDIAARLLQRRVHRVPDESPTLAPPDIAQRCAKLFREHFRDLVLKALQLLV